MMGLSTIFTQMKREKTADEEKELLIHVERINEIK